MKTGAARSDYENMAAGTFCDQAPGHLKVTVTGQSPGTGKQFTLRLDSGDVDQAANADLPQVENLGDFDRVIVQHSHDATGNTTNVKNLSAASVGELFHASGNLYMKVTPRDENNDPIAPSANKNWVWQCNGSAVTEMDDTTSVEVCPGTPDNWILS
jgi:hypothetical protein